MNYRTRTILAAAMAALLAAQAPAEANGTGNLGNWVKQQLQGHAGAHIGRSPSQLATAARAVGNEGVKSSYANAHIARQTTVQLIRKNRAQVDRWLTRNAGKPNSRLVLGNGTQTLGGLNRGQGRIGTAVTGTGRSIPAYGARVVLGRDANSSRGYRIQNSYPTVAQSTSRQLNAFRGTPAGQMRQQFNAPPRMPRR